MGTKTIAIAPFCYSGIILRTFRISMLAHYNYSNTTSRLQQTAEYDDGDLCKGYSDPSGSVQCYGYFAKDGSAKRWLKVRRAVTDNTTCFALTQSNTSTAECSVSSTIFIGVTDNAGNKNAYKFPYITARVTDAEAPRNLRLSYLSPNALNFSFDKPNFLGIEIGSTKRANKYIVYWSTSKAEMENVEIFGNLNARHRNLWRKDFHSNNIITNSPCPACNCKRGISCKCLGCRWSIVNFNNISDTTSVIIQTQYAVTHKVYYFGVAAWHDSWQESCRPGISGTNFYSTADRCSVTQYLNITDRNGKYRRPYCTKELQGAGYCDKEGDAKMHGWKCDSCPVGASCEGHVLWSGVKAKFGWYRTHWDSKLFAKCFPDVAAHACLGANTDTVYAQMDAAVSNKDKTFYSTNLRHIRDNVLLPQQNRNESNEKNVFGHNLKVHSISNTRKHGTNFPESGSFSGNDQLYCGECNKKASHEELCPALFLNPDVP